MAGLLAEAEPSEQCAAIYWEGGRAGLLFPAFQAAEIRQKVGMKDRMGNTLKPQERVLAFVCPAAQTGSWGVWELPYPHGSGVLAQESSKSSVGSLVCHPTSLPLSIQPQAYLSFLTPLPTPNLPF